MKTTIKNVVEFYKQHPEYIGKLYIDTRHGYKKIEYADITAYNSPIYRIETISRKFIEASPDHRLCDFSKGWKAIKHLNCGDFIETKDGPEEIVSKYLLDVKEDLFDFQVADVHEFYANEIVSHNSTITEVLCFTLFGKSFRKINKPQLLNTKNKRDLLCEIEFTKNGTFYLIRRGINPAIFEVYREGTLINQNAASRDYQENFEKNILQFDYNIFTQIVILGKATYIGFMKLNPDQRRKFVENILGLNIFSLMNDVHKQNIVLLKEELSEVKRNILIVKDKIEIRESYIKNLEADVKTKQEVILEKIEEKINIVQAEIETMTSEIASLEAIRPEVDHKLKETLHHRKQQLNNLIVKSSSKYDRMMKDLSFIKDNTVCPSCNQLIGEDLRATRENDLQLKIVDITKMMQDIDQKINHTSDQIDDLEATILQDHKISQRLSIINAARNEKQKQIVAFEKEKTVQLFDDVDKIAAEYNNLDLLKAQYDESLTRKSSLLDKFEYYELVSNMLKDGGIKSSIIKKYIPIINSFTNKFLKELGFFIRFEMNEEFEEKIYVRGFDELGYSNFSEGEKLRIDLSIMMMWREIAKLQNNMNTNLLVLDEITEASADQAGTEAFIELLNKQIDMNVFVISHNTDRWADKFRSSIVMTKEGGFSSIAVKG